MPYFISISIFWLAFWLLYRLLLERERFLQLNRIYLLLSFAMGLLAPLLPLGSWLQTTEFSAIPVVWLNTIQIAPEGGTSEVIANGFSGYWLLQVLFTIGCLLALGRFLLHLFQLIRLIRQGLLQQMDGYTIVTHPDVTAPYSWLQFLFWNKSLDLTASEQEAILAHEIAHIRQRHSIDLLFMEICWIIFWWNPLWYAYRRSLEEVHEYLADDEALSNISKKDYGQLLLRQSLTDPQLSLVHTFHTSQLKKRIVMMTKSPSSVYALGKYILFFPILLLVLLACEDAEAQQELVQTTDKEVTEPTYFERVDTIVTFDPSSLEESVSVVKSRIYEVVDQMPVFGECGDMSGQELKKCSNDNLFTYIYSSVKYPKEAEAAGQEGMALTEFIVNTKGEVTEVAAIDGKTTEHQVLNDAAQAVIRNLPNFKPGMQDGKAVNVKMVMPIRFALD